MSARTIAASDLRDSPSPKPSARAGLGTGQSSRDRRRPRTQPAFGVTVNVNDDGLDAPTLQHDRAVSTEHGRPRANTPIVVRSGALTRPRNVSDAPGRAPVVTPRPMSGIEGLRDTV
jgi:hypothetical protein